MWYQFWPIHAAPPYQFRTGTEDRPAPLPSQLLLNGDTFSLFFRHPCWHGHLPICLQAVYLDHGERFFPPPAHDHSSPVQHLGDERGAVPGELQLRPLVSSQRHIMDLYLPGIPVYGPFHHSRVSVATPPVVVLPWRDDTSQHTRSQSAPLRPAPGASHTWLGSAVESVGQASSC